MLLGRIFTNYMYANIYPVLDIPIMYSIHIDDKPVYID